MSYFDSYFQQRFANVVRTRADLHAYQNDLAVQFLLKNPFSALFVDLGLGKTVISLTVIADLLDNFSFERALVIGPKRVANETWPTEIEQWSHTASITWALIRDEELQDAVLKASREARAPIVAQAKEEAVRRGLDPIELNPISVQKIVREFLKIESNANAVKRAVLKAGRKAIRDATERNPATVHLINREQVENLVAFWGKDWPYDVVIIDESTSFKDHKTKRFKALRRVRPMIKRLHELTATPAAEGYEGLFAQIYLLDMGERLGRNVTAYRERYFVQNYNGYGYKLRPGADREIAEKIADICLTLKKEDYLKDLPEPIFNPRYVSLSDEQFDQYRAMERDFVMELDDGTEIEAENAAALSSKLLQLSSGFIYGERKKVHQLHDLKIDELHQIVEEAGGEPLLVACWFKPSFQRLKAAFPQAVIMDADGKAVKPWNQRKIPMLLVHPQSAGHGLNLQHGGHHLVFFDIPWSLELYLQTIGRLDRQGQLHPVVLHHIIVRRTVEELVVRTLREKRDAQEALFQYLKALRRGMLSEQGLAA